MRVHVLVALAPFAWPFSRRRSRRGFLRPNIGQGLSSARGPECGGDFFRGSSARKHHRRRRHPASPSSIPHAAPVTGREGGGLDVDAAFAINQQRSRSPFLQAQPRRVQVGRPMSIADHVHEPEEEGSGCHPPGRREDQVVATVSRPRAGRSARAERCRSRRREREFEIWQGPSAGGPPWCPRAFSGH